MGRKEKRIAKTATALVGKVVPKRLRPLTHHANGDWYNSKPSWSFSLIDHAYDGDWGWGRFHEKQADVFDFLREMEKLSWKEIGEHMYRPKNKSARQKHHTQPVASLCPEAQSRLMELDLDDLDEVYRFRLGFNERLWGVIVPSGPVFCLLWWDPNHMVYPMENN